MNFSHLYQHPLFIMVALLSGLIVDCAKTAPPNEIVIKEVGFRMKAPAGWKIGMPAIEPGRKFKPAPDGDHCFYSEKSSYPYGKVWLFPLTPFSSLAEYVKTPPTLHGLTLTQTPIQVYGYQGIEVLSSGLGENRLPVKGIYQYILKRDTVIVASFLTIADSFPNQEHIFRSALKTIEIK